MRFLAVRPISDPHPKRILSTALRPPGTINRSFRIGRIPLAHGHLLALKRYSSVSPPSRTSLTLRPEVSTRPTLASSPSGMAMATGTVGAQTHEPSAGGDGATPPPPPPPPRQVLFFDIDNCLYPKSASVHDLMADLIDAYFEKHLSLPKEEAVRLNREYYRNYGLAIEGLVRHHQIDPLEYNAKVDDALPLDDVIKPRPELRRLLEDVDKTKVKLWLFTNAYVNHGHRVVRLLGVEDMFHGMTYCDYAKVPFVCKPHEEAYVKAMKEAGVEKWHDCFFVDDSYANCAKAQELGWTTAHLVEDEISTPERPASRYQIRHLEDLRAIFPQFFKEPTKIN